MGVDYYECHSCSHGFRDDSEYVFYCECGSHFCSVKCGEPTNYGEWNDDTESNRINNDEEITCVVCREEVFTDYALLQGLLKHFNIDREQAIELVRKK
jgi:hypothetical protein